MPLELEGEVYYTASEAAKYVGVSRPTFYQNVVGAIPEYRIAAYKRVYYRKTDLDRYKGIHPVEPDQKDR